MRYLKWILLLQSTLLVVLAIVIIVLIIQTTQTHEAIRLVCRYLAGG